MSLPPLRQELTLHPGPATEDGAPTWMLHDPAANRFFQLGWPAFEILSRWSLSDPARIIAAVNAETTLAITPADMEALLTLLQRHHLLIAGDRANTELLLRARQAGKLGLWQWLLHHYLFFRIPLIKPMPLLARLSRHVGWAFTPRFWWLVGGVALLGLYLVSRRWEEFTHTFSAYSGVERIIGIGLALSFAKVLHELGHALTAYRHGCRVPTMGVAFLVMLPVLYTDTNDAWKLQSRRQRLQIGAAGMAAELALAAFATLLWNFLPEGPLRAGVFFLATTTWIATIAINASPFMRFDGYFILSDWLDISNLHARAGAFGRWFLREKLFGHGDAEPEAVSAKRQRFLIGFAYTTWLYRLALFLSIALLVYHFFFKALGVILLFVELGFFIALPIFSEFKAWWQRREDIHWNFETRRSSAVLALLIAFVLIPWQTSIKAPAVLSATQEQGIYAPEAATLLSLQVKDGQAVKAGQLLATLASPELLHQLGQAQADEAQLRWQAEQQSFNDDLMKEGPALQKRWQAAQEAVSGIKAQIAQLTVTAPFDGTVEEEDALSTGTWVRKGEKLFQVTGPNGVKAEAYVSEADLPRLRQGGEAHFVASRPGEPAVDCHVSDIDRLNVAVLDALYLASPFGGPIPAQLDKKSGMVPLSSVFRVRLDACHGLSNTRQELPGVAVLKGDNASLFMRGVRTAVSVWQREAGL